MEVMIRCGGNPEIAKLIDGLWIDLERVPCVGESLKIYIKDYHLLMKVSDVMTMYVTMGNPHFKEAGWGKTEFVITVEDEEIVEKYNHIEV